MHPFADTTLFATIALAAAAASLTAFGLRRRHAGWLWWVLAVWLTALGTAVSALWPGPLGTALAAPWLLQGPLLTLTGLRRFHARHAWPGGSRLDALMLAGMVAACLLASQLPAATAAWLLAACGLAVHLYVATLLFMGPGGRAALPVQTLAATLALLAFAPGLAAFGPGFAATPAAQSPVLRGAEMADDMRLLCAALGAIVTAFVALTLVFERTERQLRQSRRRLAQLANLDALTQVPNRRRFEELAAWALYQDPPGSAVLLLFDIDHFKQVNDQFGHAAGDRALCLVAASMALHLRAPDVAGRHGGDEFALLLRHAGTAQAMRVAARIVAELQSQAHGQQLPPLSLSFGLVQMGAGEPLAAALRRADQALYEAKRQGRSRAVAARGDEQQPVFTESRPLGLTAC